MKFNLHQSGERRDRAQFLLLPKCINYQIRWLEYAEWTETYREAEFWMGYKTRTACWSAEQWVN